MNDHLNHNNFILIFHYNLEWFCVLQNTPDYYLSSINTHNRLCVTVVFHSFYKIGFALMLYFKFLFPNTISMVKP